MFCSPSIHKDGLLYEIIGTAHPITLNIVQARELIQHINQICINHGVHYLDKVSTIGGRLKDIIKSLTINHAIEIPQGQRHITLISLADSLLFTHLGKGKKTENQLKASLTELMRSFVNLLCKVMRETVSGKAPRTLLPETHGQVMVKWIIQKMRIAKELTWW